MSLLQQIRHYKPSALTLTTLMYGVLCFVLIKNTSYPVLFNYQVFTECLERNTAVLDGENIKAIEMVKLNDFFYQGQPITFAYTKQAIRMYRNTLQVNEYINSIKENIATDYNTNYLSIYEIKQLDSTLASCKEYLLKDAPDDYREQFQNELYFLWKDLNNFDCLKAQLTNKNKTEVNAILSTIQNNLTLSTLFTLYHISKTNGDISVRFDAIEVATKSQSQFAFKGEKVTFETFFYGKSHEMTNATTNEGIVVDNYNGRGIIQTTPQKPGIHYLKGTINISRGIITRFNAYNTNYHWQTQYYVAPKGIYMHIDNANKCYAGIPFNMTIGLEEYSSDKLSLRSKDAVIKKLNVNTYTITAHKGVKSFMVYMDAINADGSKSTSVAAKHIIVLQPTPDIAIGDIKHGLINKLYINQHATLSAIAKDEDLDITYNIKQYDISYIRAGNKYTEPVTIQGNTLSNTNTLQSGDRIFISDAIVTDNYGNTHHIPATSFRVE